MCNRICYSPLNIKGTFLYYKMNKIYRSMGSEFVAAVTAITAVFWAIMPCSS
jgi:hypothetical protein